jgi:hypothetical protein
VGVEPTGHQGLSLAAMPVRVPCRLPFLSSPAPPRGFETLISSSTARRALRAAPRGRVDRDITTSGPGGSRTLKHLLLKQAALPVCLPGHPYHSAKSSSTRGGTRTHDHPVLSRAARPLAYPGNEMRKPWDSNPQAVSPAARFQDGFLIRPVGFRLRLRKVPGAGIEPATSAFRARDYYQQ